jgi:hypothetical protein
LLYSVGFGQVEISCLILIHAEMGKKLCIARALGWVGDDLFMFLNHNFFLKLIIIIDK